MKKIIVACTFLLAFLAACQAQGNRQAAVQTAESNVISLDREGFLRYVYNFEKNPNEWVFEGTLPAIVNFYADWCPPCRLLAPILEELALEYKGRIVIYRVNTDRSRDLATTFGIRSLPTLFFCPVGGQAQAARGLLPREQIVELIETILLNN